MTAPQQPETVLVELNRDKAEHLFGRCTESTNAPKINGYSCEECREIGETLRAALQHSGDEQQVGAEAVARAVADILEEHPCALRPHEAEARAYRILKTLREQGETNE